MPQDNIVFLLGAGTSVDAGLPTAIQLAEKVEIDLEAIHPPLLPALRFIKGAVLFGKACRGEPSNSSINVEDILSACSFLNSRESSYAYPFVGAWHERIRTLEQIPEDVGTESNASNTFEFLSTFCKKRLQTWLRVTDNNSVAYLERLVDFVEKGFTPHIFSLNYDECVELAFNNVLGEINRSWTTGFGKRGWEQQLLANNYSTYLYKLHGSLDWINDPKLGICSVKWPDAEQSDELPSEFDPLLIFGIDVKFQATDPFLTLLFHFRQHLSLAKIIVVIGYGFRDNHINAMILDALQRSSQMRCIVVNKTNLDALLPTDSDFRKLLNVEQRFIAIEKHAKEALESGEILTEVHTLLDSFKEELPF